MQDATIKSAGVVALIVLVGVAALVPVLGYARQIARCQQNMDQLRGIHQGCVVFSQGSKSGGGDGFFPGVTSRGVPLLDTPRNRIDGGSLGLDATFGNHNDIHGYDRDGNGDIDPDEMNDPETGEGFVQYVFAELLTGDFIPAGSADYFVNPADTLKGSFDPGDPGEAGRFDMSKISYTLLNVSVDALYGEWRETVNPRAIVFADRAVGDGDTFGSSGSTASSVWTDPASGAWRGALTRNDSSTVFGTSHAILDGDVSYGGISRAIPTGDPVHHPTLTFQDNDIFNLFAHPTGEELERIDETTIRKDQGVLFDQDEAGRATGI